VLGLAEHEITRSPRFYRLGVAISSNRLVAVVEECLGE
jgi:hypothetical protein